MLADGHRAMLDRRASECGHRLDNARSGTGFRGADTIGCVMIVRVGAGATKEQLPRGCVCGGRQRLNRSPKAEPRNSLPADHRYGPAGSGYFGVRAMAERSDTTRIVRSTTEARDAVTGHNVRYVLYIGTAAVVVIFAALWFYYFHGVNLTQ
jgi:hypothetical protein